MRGNLTITFKRNILSCYFLKFRAIQEKMCKMQRTREEMNAFKEAQNIWREKQKKELQEENMRIQEYIKKINEDERRRFLIISF